MAAHCQLINPNHITRNDMTASPLIETWHLQLQHNMSSHVAQFESYSINMYNIAAAPEVKGNGSGNNNIPLLSEMRGRRLLYTSS